MPKNSSAPRTNTSRNTSRSSPPSGEIQVSAQWLVKTLGVVVAASIVLTYIVACGLVYFAQSRFLFETSYIVDKTPADFGVKYQDIKFGSAPATAPTLAGWWIPAATPTTHTLLYLHGNAATISGNAERAVGFQKLGANVFLFDYRGFGNSLREFPNEQRVYEDAETAWSYLVQERHLKPQEIVVFGSSLGGAVAAELVRRHPQSGGLILESAFTSIAALSHLQHRFTLLPFGLLLHERFDTLDKLSRIQTPVLIVQGEADREVPVSMARELYGAARKPKWLVTIPNGGHEGNAKANPKAYDDAISEFLKRSFETAQ